MLPFIRLISAVLARMPEAFHRVLATALAGLIYYGLPGRRRAVRSNLAHAFPDRPHKWIARTARASCRQLVETGLFALVNPHLRTREIRRMLTCGESFAPVVERIMREKRPTVLAVPHLGAWEAGPMLPGIYDGPMPEVGCAYRPLDHAALDTYVRQTRERFGVHMLSRKEGFTEGMHILRRCGVYAMLFDQSAGDRGMLSLLFGRVCSSTHLPGLMVEKFDARLVMLYVRRLAFWRYVIELDCPEETPRDESGTTRYLDRWLENLLSRDETLCASWLWLHNRWKTQVAPERRFRLEHKRSALGPDEVLPRRTRFFVRLPNWLGDVVMALPLVRALRQSRPDVALTAIVKPAFVPLVARTGLFEDVLPLPARGWGYFLHFWKLRRRYPDCWILFTNSTRGDLEAWAACCRQRFGMLRPGKRRPLLTHAWKVPADLDETKVHQTRVWEKFFQRFGLRQALDLHPVDLGELPSPLPGVGPDVKWIGLIAGTENFPAKRWPVEHWCAFVAQIAGSNPDVRFALFGTATDRAITNQIVAATANGPAAGRVHDIAGNTGLLEFAGGLRRCTLVVANDTGGMHLANMLGVPVVGLFGPTNPVRTGPIYTAPTFVLQPPHCPKTGGGSLADLPAHNVTGAVAVTLRF